MLKKVTVKSVREKPIEKRFTDNLRLSLGQKYQLVRNNNINEYS